ncbi:amidase [Hydrogenophaga sp. BPS33]|uniref:amidase n=1 Tax=Hydrogenophaga sp. BPS33 TaxID=2651974 RepID=UPI00135A09F0|nr:amidase [Hydrogenophaga sp. BPS33]
MLARLTLTQAAQGLQSRQWTVPDIVDDVLRQAHGVGAAHNAFLSVFDEHARSLARAHTGHDTRPLAGVPLSLKDDLFTAGLRTTGGSPQLQDFVPTADAPAVARLRKAGAIVFGKTNLSDFAMSLAHGSSLGGPCRNPWDPARSAGASSSGAACAVAAGIGAVAIATDTGGSIRYPAALCGVLGFAPSNGRVPRHGSFGANRFFCAIGVLARDVRDVAKLLAVMSGADPSDAETARHPQPLLSDALDATRAQGLRVGVLDTGTAPTPRGRAIDALWRTTMSNLARERRWAMEPVALDFSTSGHAFKVISDADRLSLMTRSGTLAHLDEALLPDALRQRFEHARGLSEADVARAMAERASFTARIDTLFGTHDLLIGLTHHDVAPLLSETGVPFELAWTNLAGCPAASVPLGLVDGLPIGLHIVARPGHDETVLNACAALQASWAPEGFSAAPGR